MLFVAFVISYIFYIDLDETNEMENEQATLRTGETVTAPLFLVEANPLSAIRIVVIVLYW